MGVVLNLDLDTNLGASRKVYFRIENINLNRTFGKVKVAVTYWVSQEYCEALKHSTSRNPLGQISNLIVYYENDEDLGREIKLPTYFEFDLTKPQKVMIPIYAEKEIAEEIPYVAFDEAGRRTTKYRTVVHKIKNKIGEKEDLTQVLDLNIETNLVSWCYGQIKASLSNLLPPEKLEDC